MYSRFFAACRLLIWLAQNELGAVSCPPRSAYTIYNLRRLIKQGKRRSFEGVIPSCRSRVPVLFHYTTVIAAGGVLNDACAAHMRVMS